MDNYLLVNALLCCMARFLTDGQVKEFRELHRKISESKKSDRIKAILLLNDGYTEAETAKILLRDESSIWRWLDIFTKHGIKTLLKDNYLGGTPTVSYTHLTLPTKA